MTLDQKSSKTINFPIFPIDLFKLFDPMKITPSVILMPEILVAIGPFILRPHFWKSVEKWF